MKRELKTTHAERNDLGAWLTTQGVHDRNPVTLDALIHLFRSLTEGGDDHALVQGR